MLLENYLGKKKLMKKEKLDHLLEHVYLLLEEGDNGSGEKNGVRCDHASLNGYAEFLPDAEESKLLVVNGETMELTKTGVQKAESLIRRHRLTERLLKDLLQISEEEMEAQACKFEHVLSPEVEDSICTLLGHPTFCPHGRKIPRGECCKGFKTELSPVVVPLHRLEVGKTSKIIFTTPAYHKRYERLTLLGVEPGAIISLYQKYPSFVIKVDETEIALDGEVAREIFVRPFNGKS